MTQTRPWPFISVVLQGTGVLAAGIHTDYDDNHDDDDDDEDDDSDLVAP